MDDDCLIQRVAQIAINAKDLQRAILFYRDTLRLDLLFEIPSAAFFQCGDLRLMVAVPEDEKHAHPSSILYYGVPDIQEVFRRLSAYGVMPEREPHLIGRMGEIDVWMAFLWDSEQNLFALTSEVPVLVEG